MSSQFCAQLTFSGFPNPSCRETFPQTVGFFFVVCNTLLKNFSQQSQTNGLPILIFILFGGIEGQIPGPRGREPSTDFPVLFRFLVGPIHPVSTSLLGTFKPNNRSHFAARSLLHFYFFLFFLPLAIFHFAAYLLKSKKRKKLPKPWENRGV